MMNTVILPSALMPNLDYLKIISETEMVLIERFETYPRQTYRNRYQIAGPNGVQKLIVPVVKTVLHNSSIAQIRVSYDGDWPKQHWRSIVTAYNSSPFFLYYKDDFYSIFMEKHINLLDMNMLFLKLILKILQIKTKIEFTMEFQSLMGEPDYRKSLHPRMEQFFENKPFYYQVFSDKNGFIPNLSVIDLIFNLGPESTEVLKSIT